jgi:hypothetical protein
MIGGTIMGEKVTETMQKVKYSGKTIWLSDYRGLKGNDYAKRIRENGEMGETLGIQGINERLILADVRGCYATSEVMEAFKEATRKTKPYVKASAVVGVTGIQRHILAIVNQFSGIGSKPFKTIEQAMDWLVKQADK